MLVVNCAAMLYVYCSKYTLDLQNKSVDMAAMTSFMILGRVAFRYFKAELYNT